MHECLIVVSELELTNIESIGRAFCERKFDLRYFLENSYWLLVFVILLFLFNGVVAI